MPIHGYPDHSGGPEMYDDPDLPDRCECGCGEFVGDDGHRPEGSGLAFVSLRHFQAWLAESEAADRARVVGEVIDPERTERIPVESNEQVVNGRLR